MVLEGSLNDAGEGRRVHGDSDGPAWLVGPDQANNVGSYVMFGQRVLERIEGLPSWGFNDAAIYDATNGTVSAGDIVRVGP